MQKENNFGVCIVAMGNEMYYKYAVNLAASIKELAIVPIRICLIHDGKQKSIDFGLKLFDDLVECPKEIYWDEIRERNDYMRVKLSLDELSPYRYTLYLDADTIAIAYSPVWFSRLSITHLLGENPFIAQCYEHSDMSSKATKTGYTYWADPKAIKHYYKFYEGQILPQLSTTILLYDRDNEIVKNIFKEARAAYNDKGRPVQNFGNMVPDEYFFNVACCKVGYAPPIQSMVYWHFLHGTMGVSYEDRMPRIKAMFPYMTLGGGHSPDYAKEIYNKRAIEVAKHYVFNTIWAMDKKDHVQDRATFVKRREENVVANIRDFLRHPHVINLPHRKDRMKSFQKVMGVIGIKDYERVDGIIPDTHPETIDKGNYGCMLSHQSIIREAVENEWDRVMVFEDDCTGHMVVEPGDNLSFAAFVLDDYLLNMPEDWDMIYFGGNHMLHNPTRHKSVYRAWGLLTSHAILYRNTIYDAVLNMEPNGPYDICLSRLQRHYRVYCPDPNAPIFWQLDGHSDIMGGEVKYDVLKPKVV